MKRRREDLQKKAENGFENFGDYMQAKVTKLEEQFLDIQYDIKQKSRIFEGVSILVNGHTNPSADNLKRIMMEHGGMFHHYQTSSTKFVVASNLPDVKIRQYNMKNVIKPEWIVDCLKANRLVDHTPYLLVTNTNRKQPTISFGPKSSIDLSDKVILDAPQESQDEFSFNINQLNDKVANNSNVKRSEPVSTKAAAKTAVDPGFLEEFFSNSRLHHIATLGADFKYLISNWRRTHDGKFPEREVLKAKLNLSHRNTDEKFNNNVIVMHIDMDCFFVSVSLRRYPHLRGHPVAVTHSKGKKESNGEPISMSEIASCSYEARAKGLKNGMFVGQALKLCPNLKTIPYDFDQYRETAMFLYNCVAKYTMDIEAVSCDELYADLRSLLDECKIEVEDFVLHLREEIYNATGCTCSVGIGSNRLAARMATKKAKPNGQFSLIDENVEEYMQNIPIKELPGVGPNIEFQLNNLNINNCGEIQICSLQILQTVFGKKMGESLQMMARGIDNKKLVYNHVRKSVSVEVNYGIRFSQDDQVNIFMRQMAIELSKRLRDIEKRGKLLTLKLMIRAQEASVETKKFMGHGIVDKTSKSMPLLSATNDDDIIHDSVMKLMRSLDIPPEKLRGIGIQMTKFDEEKHENQLLKLFENHKKLSKTDGNLSNRGEQVELNEKVYHSPMKKGRQKQKKSKNSKNITTTSIEEMFKKRKASQTPNSKMQTVENIDFGVLAELPPELVDEIMEEYQIQNEESETDSMSSTSQRNMSSQSSSNASDNEEDQEDKTIPFDNMFLKQDWRQQVDSFLQSENENVDGLSKDLISLVYHGEIELIYIVMRFLSRKANEIPKDSFKNIYYEIEKRVQNAMMSKYSKQLHIKENL